MVIKCAVVSLEETLLSKAMESLLEMDPDLVVSSITYQNPDELFVAIVRFEPDVVVLINPNLGAIRCVLSRMLADYPDIPVVTAGADDNWLHVYPGEIAIQRPVELFDVIHSL